MFTGIIEDLAKVKTKSARGAQMQFWFETKRPQYFKSGESIAVNGVCLTAAGCGKNNFKADVIEDTLKSTTLGKLKTGEWVHIERSLRAGDRIGGHFVTGHADGTGTLRKIEKNGNNTSWEISAPKKIMKWIVPKGSIALDGVSLTIQRVTASAFTVGLVPHTLKKTAFSFKKLGDAFNLEADLLAKYCKDIPERSKVRAKIEKEILRTRTNAGMKQLKRKGF